MVICALIFMFIYEKVYYNEGNQLNEIHCIIESDTVGFLTIYGEDNRQSQALAKWKTCLKTTLIEEDKARISLRMYRNFQGALPFREIEEASLNESLSTIKLSPNDPE